MRVAVYKDNLSTGRGADGAVKNFAAGLAERGHDVSLFDKTSFAVSLAKHWDVYVATGSNEAIDLDRAGYFVRHDRAPVVLQLHLAPHGFFKWKRPFRNWRIRKSFNKVDAAQVLCSSYASGFSAIAPRPSVCVIGNYVNAVVALQPPSKQNVILYPAAAVNKIKNQKLLIRAFALVAADFPDWRVRLLGKVSTSYAEECRKLVLKLGLENRIEFVGFTNQLTKEYSRAVFVAFPSVLEGFPLAVLEAAQHSLPTVAQRSLPGVDDIIVDGTGIVTEPSVKSYAAGLRRMMSDANLRAQMGEAARKYCAEHYARERILDQWEALLQSVANRRA